VERLTDERLVELLKRGETRALDDLYRRHARKVFVFFRSGAGLRDPQDCEDAVHDVFMRVVRGAGTFDASRASFRTWLARIARNLAIDIMRRRDRAKTVAIINAPEAEAFRDGVISEDTLPSRGDDTEAEYIKASTARSVRDCIGELENGEEQQAIVLYYLHDRVYREIGEILGESTSMARNRIKAAQAKIRDCLERKGVTGW
jgi:RNA polymerase sigma-70 factor (ECF subfamily)